MEPVKCRLCGERHWNTGLCPSFVDSSSPSRSPRVVEAAPAPAREPEIASDVSEAVPCPPAPKALVVASNRGGMTNAVVDAVADLALSADEIKKAKQRERMRVYMQQRRAKEREANQQQSMQKG